MKKILIINFKRHGDIFFSSQIAASIKAQHPFSQVELICYKEFEQSAKTVSLFNNIHLVDRKKISFLYRTKNFSKALALDTFYNDIYEAITTQWDWVVNLSNDKTSSFISSLLSSQKYTGIKFNSKALIDSDSPETNFLNEVVSQKKVTPHLVDIFCATTKTPFYKTTNSIKIRDEDTKLVYKNFNDIRNAVGASYCKIVGIQFFSSNQTKNLSEKTLKKLLTRFCGGSDYFPIVLVSKDKKEHEIINRVNKSLDNKIVTIESDFRALASVLQQVDILITVDSAAKHLADMMDTPTIEISAGAAPVYQQSSIKEGNIVLSPLISCRPCKLSEGCNNQAFLECHQLFSAEDIFNCVELSFGEDIRRLEFSPTTTIYRVEYGETGHYLHPIAGSVEAFEFLDYFFSRLFLRNLNNDDEVIRTDRVNFIPKTDFENWKASQKHDIALFTKDLLRSIRLLKEVYTSKTTNTEPFIKSLQKIFDHSQKGQVVSIISQMLRGEVENVYSSDLKENLKSIEKSLFLAKNRIKNSLKNIELISVSYERDHKTPSKADSSIEVI